MRLDRPSNESTPAKPLRKLALRPAEETSPPADAKGRHFVAPWRLDDASKEAIVQALEQRNIGDPEGRRLFAGALEYQLATYRELEAAAPVAPEPPPATDTAALDALAAQAGEFARLLAEIPREKEPELLRTLAEQDEMGRDYAPRYLDILYTEASRLAEASALLAAGLRAAPPPAAPASQPSAALLVLLRSLAQVFEECFEQVPSAAPQGPFAKTLKVISDHLAVEIPHSKAMLEAVLT
jgi:hypothetical protein